MAMIALVAVGCGRTPGRAARVEADAVPDPYLEPTATLMWPGATRAVRILPSGALATTAWTLRLEPAADGIPAAAPKRIAFEDRWLPVAYWTERSADLRWEFEAVPAPLPESGPEALRHAVERAPAEVSRVELGDATPDARADRLRLRTSRRQGPSADEVQPLAVSLEVRVSNVGSQPRVATLSAELVRTLAVSDPAGTAPGDRSKRRHARPAPVADAAVVDSGWASPETSHAMAVVEHPRDRDALRQGVTLSPGESRVVTFALVTHSVSRGRLEAWVASPHARRVTECRAYWRREIRRGTRFDLGDVDLERAIAAARVTLLSLRERRDGAWTPLAGPVEDRDVWPREAARSLQALALHGYVAEARAMAEGLLEAQWPEGPFAVHGDPRTGTGQTLWAMEQVLLRPEPAADVRRYAEAADRAWRWSDRVRDAHWPSSRASHGHGGENAPGRSMSADLWAIAGERAAARLLDAAGLRDRATVALAARERHRKAFERAVARGGHRDVPASWSGTAPDWDNLEVAVPCDVLPPDHPRVRSLMERYWQAARAGIPYYGTPARLQAAPAADLATQSMRVGRSGRADSVLAALVHWTNASGGASASFDRRTGDAGADPPPDAAPAAALLTLVRQALIEDDGDRLELTLGARRSWWIRGASVRGAPTRWGTLSLQFDWRGDVARWHWTPVRVWTELTLPPNTRLMERPRAPLLGDVGGTRVLVPPGVGAARVRLRDVTPPGRRALPPTPQRPPVLDEDPEATELGGAPADDTDLDLDLGAPPDTSNVEIDPDVPDDPDPPVPDEPR